MNLRNSHSQRRVSARQGRGAKARALSGAEFSPNKEDSGAPLATFTWQNGVCGLGGPWGKPDVGGRPVREEPKEEGPGAPAAFSTRSRLLSGEMGKKRGETALPVDMPASGSALGRVPRTVGAKRPPSESPGRQADSHPKELLQEGLRMPMEPPSHLPPHSTRQG